MKMRESPTYCRTGFTTPGDAQPCRCSLICTNSSTPNSAKRTFIRYGGKIVPSSVPDVTARTLIHGGSITIDPGANGTGVTAASAPSTTSLTPCSTGASGQSRTGFLPRFCCVSRARHAASPESWGSIAAPAIGGAGGCAMPPCPMRCTANWRGRWKPMTSTILPGNKGQAQGGGKKAVGRRPTWPAEETRARSGPLRQRPARDHRLGQSSGSGRHPSDQRFHGADRPEGRGHRDARGQSALHRLGEQLSGV